jgi:Uma2 family endonuclease
MDFTEPRALVWTAEEYYRLGEAEWFQGKRVELIGGEIIEMPPQMNWHALGIGKTEHALRTAFGPNFWVRGQMSLDLSPLSVPDPDVAVIAGAMQTHRTRANPRTALLVVEVAETTLSYDRNAKASLYAASGIADYWIINILGAQLEVYRDPVANPQARFGHNYSSLTILRAGDVVSPLALPGVSIQVADLLP